MIYWGKDLQRTEGRGCRSKQGELLDHGNSVMIALEGGIDGSRNSPRVQGSFEKVLSRLKEAQGKDFIRGSQHGTEMAQL